MLIRIITVLLIAYFHILVLRSEESENFKIREVAGNFKTIWEMTWGPDNHIWLSERYGRISRVNPETGDVNVLLTIPDVFEGGERGLMGIDLHPNFINNPYLYAAYNYGSTNENSRIRIVRYTYINSKLSEPFILLDDIKGWWNHNGARVKIGDDGKLWFTIGDAAESQRAQNLNNLNGKLSRMNLDGTVPDDNPYTDNYIWSFGHRNQQGLVLANGKVYTSEHGSSTNDEINLIKKGRNYGWPNVQGFCDSQSEITFCEQNNVVEPILSLYPNHTLAIAGMAYYEHSLLPDWNNSLIISSLKAENLVIANLDDEGETVIGVKEMFNNKFGRLRAVCVAPDGRVFVGTSNQDGRASSKFRDSMDKIFEIKSTASSNINTYEDSGELRIFPNPSQTSFTISTSTKIQDAEISILDMTGNLVLKTSYYSQSKFHWDGMSQEGKSCPPGIYFIRVNNNSKLLYGKVSLIR